MTITKVKDGEDGWHARLSVSTESTSISSTLEGARGKRSSQRSFAPGFRQDSRHDDDDDDDADDLPVDALEHVEKMRGMRPK